MTLDINEMERRGNAATPPPWNLTEPPKSLVPFIDKEDWEPADDEFIVFARNHWPAIIAALRDGERLREEVNELNNVLRRAGWGQGEIDNAATVLDEAEAEVKRLREENERLGSLCLKAYAASVAEREAWDSWECSTDDERHESWKGVNNTRNDKVSAVIALVTEGKRIHDASVDAARKQEGE